jgi:NADPH:quinone reductase-like Zn-dependent oxidoreductase
LTLTGTITPDEYAEAHAAIVQGLQAGQLRPVVGTELPLDKAAEAHHAVIEQSGGAKGKIVLVME